MKKLISIVFILTLALFVVPSQTYAAWWNPLTWFAKDKQVIEEQKPQTGSVENNNSNQTQQADTTKTETPTPITNSERQQPIIAPSINSSQDAENVAALRTEIATLKASLDTLYAAHNRLVNDHNSLLEYTKNTAVQKQPTTPTTIVQQTDNSALERRVSELERKAKLVSDELYGDRISGGLNLRVSKLESSGGNNLNTKVSNLEKTINDICRSAFNSPYCPILLIGGNLESRIKKLERGY